ncbi:MAG: type IV secretory system conjugative DNA transfer family protein [Patescibacteria group bacterium]|nr:type IV secretory system conjugative DNA transfer family protein [Patescibacteria group bacterium]
MENPERVTYFAATDARGKLIPFGIKSKDRDRHMYVIGKTGMGKSTLLENMAIQDIRNGEGIAFLDPHGATVDRLLDYIPEERVKDVVYFAPFDLEHPIAFNVMEDVGYDKRHLVVSGLMATFKKIWEDAWSARMEYILTNTLLALLEYPDATLLGVNRMYTDKDYRTKVVDNVKDPVVKDFWTKEFANYGDRYTQEATPAIQNKIGQFTGNPLIRNIIGQPKSSFDIRTMMDQKKILIMNLSKGLVGETNMRLLGSMLTTRLFLGAMSRANLSGPELTKLPHFYFYVDEFQNFANQTFAEILSESRKYKLNLIITNQYIEQMEEEVRDAVFGNVGTTVAFRVGPFDAEVLETVFMPKFLKEDIVGLDKRQVYLTLMIDGVGSSPFSAVTIPPIEAPPVSHRQEVIDSSREQFSTQRAGIETAIMEEFAVSAAAPVPLDARMKKKPPMRSASSYTPTSTHTTPSHPPTQLRQGYDGHSKATEGTVRSPEIRPAPPSKSAEDLKAILRNMTAKTGAEREQKQSHTQQELKGTLADVLQLRRQESGLRPEASEKPVTIQPPQQKAPTSEVGVPTGSVGKEKKPFEVPEEELRDVLKGKQ